MRMHIIYMVIYRWLKNIRERADGGSEIAEYKLKLKSPGNSARVDKGREMIVRWFSSGRSWFVRESARVKLH